MGLTHDENPAITFHLSKNMDMALYIRIEFDGTKKSAYLIFNLQIIILKFLKENKKYCSLLINICSSKEFCQLLISFSCVMCKFVDTGWHFSIISSIKKDQKEIFLVVLVDS